jgi:DNA-binding transcriptional LysR family regulator
MREDRLLGGKGRSSPRSKLPSPASILLEGAMERQWDALRFFLEVARSRSPSAAARSLLVSEATVRRRIAALEGALGVVLFEREGGNFLPTRAALEMMPAVETMEEVSLRAIERLKDTDRQVTGLVRIGAPDGIATVLLAPLLAEFQRAHPGLSIDLVTLKHAVDLRRREVDVAITWDRPTQGQHRIRALRPPMMRIYATRAYLQDHGDPIRSVDDLQGHRFVSYPGTSYLARSLPELLSASNVSLTPAFTSSSVLAQASAAASGAGLALLPDYIAARHPELIGVLHETFAVPFPIWLVIHGDMAALARVRAVADLMFNCFIQLDP